MGTQYHREQILSTDVQQVSISVYVAHHGMDGTSEIPTIALTLAATKERAAIENFMTLVGISR